MSKNNSVKSPLPTITDPDKYSLVFENNKVRVYDYKDKPGNKTKLHYHDSFILYALSAFERKIHFNNGKTAIRTFNVGEVLWSEGENHIGENIGKTDTHVLIVELK